MQRYWFFILILNCTLTAAFGQGAEQLELARRLLGQSRYQAAAQVAEQAYHSGKRNGETAIQIQACLLQAEAYFGKQTAHTLRWGQKIRIKRQLKEAAQLLERNPIDSLEADLLQLQNRLEDRPAQGLEPGGVAQKRPTLKELKNRKLDAMRAVGDTLLSLKKEKAVYEKEVEALTAAQARQELMLARQQKTIDSISLARLEDSIKAIRQEQLLQAQEAELALRRTQRNRSLILTAAIIVIALVLTWLYINSRRKKRMIEQERRRSDELLLNILPAAVARELKEKGSAAARHYPEVTVLFSDFKDFSRVTKDLRPEALVAALDRCFRAFDEIAERHGLEKIKTIGDAYMCACGLPEPSPDQANRAVKAALDMQQWLAEHPDLPFPGARIGLHTGAVVAGVVGARKFAYDIWGDTVNLAARLESKGEAGKVNISQATYERINGAFHCIPRGKIKAKGIGEVEMYFVELANAEKLHPTVHREAP